MTGDEIPEDLYARVSASVRDGYGLELGELGKALLASRLAPRLAQLGGMSVASYLACVGERADERARLVELLCTHETRFFREPQHFEFVATHLAPAWRRAVEAGTRAPHVRVWCAACSSGEEPFSLAMTLRDALPAGEGWTVEIVATDLSRSILAVAQAATWPIEKVDPIPEDLRRRHLLRGFGASAGTFRARPELRELVRFECHNLLESAAGLGTFDLVMCRNVLIYFRRELRSRVVGHLLDQLRAGGHLVVGHAESLIGVHPALHSVRPTVYRYEPGRG